MFKMIYAWWIKRQMIRNMVKLYQIDKVEARKMIDEMLARIK